MSKKVVKSDPLENLIKDLCEKLKPISFINQKKIKMTFKVIYYITWRLTFFFGKNEISNNKAFCYKNKLHKLK